MSRAGVASRRVSERHIRAGRIAVNGIVVLDPAQTVIKTDLITVDGKVLPDPGKQRLWRYYKQRGDITTHSDERGRPTVFDRLPSDMGRVMSIGRLDINSEGLMLLTNDGGLKRLIELPSTGWKRVYRVRAFGQFSQGMIDEMGSGMMLGKVKLRPMEVTIDQRTGRNGWLTIGICEGKNREIRNALEKFGLAVNRLIRIAYGPLELGRLEPGMTAEVKGAALARISRELQAIG